MGPEEGPASRFHQCFPNGFLEDVPQGGLTGSVPQWMFLEVDHPRRFFQGMSPEGCPRSWDPSWFSPKGFQQKGPQRDILIETHLEHNLVGTPAIGLHPGKPSSWPISDSLGGIPLRASPQRNPFSGTGSKCPPPVDPFFGLPKSETLMGPSQLDTVKGNPSRGPFQNDHLKGTS